VSLLDYFVCLLSFSLCLWNSSCSATFTCLFVFNWFC